MLAIVVAVALLQFTGPTGARIDLNPQEISSIRDPRASPVGHWGKGTNCIVVMNNGKFIAVAENCDEVRATLRGASGSAPCVLVCGETKETR